MAKLAVSRFLTHHNGNQWCAMCVDTTGPQVELHEIIQVAILPLDASLNPLAGHLPFNTILKPDKPEYCDNRRLRKVGIDPRNLNVNGLDPILVGDLLESWIESLRLGDKAGGTPRQIIPIAFEYSTTIPFLHAWLGKLFYNLYFKDEYRDIKTSALYMKDRFGWYAGRDPIPKVDFSYICSSLGVKQTHGTNALARCWSIAQAYKKMLSHMLPAY